MNAKLNRVLDEIARTEEKIAVWREHLEELNIRKKQLEDAEIIKSVRAMKLGSREMLAFLEKIQSGTLSVRSELTDMEEGWKDGESEASEGHREAETEQGQAGDSSVVETEPGQRGDIMVTETELRGTENNSEPETVPAEREDREDEEKD